MTVLAHAAIAEDPRSDHDGGRAHHHAHELSSTSASGDVLISARGLWLTRSGRIVLEGIDLDISRGEIVTLIGPNGAGKTTLVRVLLGLIKPDRGEVRRSPGLSIGYVPQRFDIDRAIPMTVARFLRLGRPGEPRQIQAVLEEVGAPHVLEQQLSEPLRRRVAARAACTRAARTNPQLLVLDEPVRGVDYAGEAELYTLIGRLRTSRGLRACFWCRTTCTLSWPKAIAWFVSTDTFVALACRKRSPESFLRSAVRRPRRTARPSRSTPRITIITTISQVRPYQPPLQRT